MAKDSANGTNGVANGVETSSEMMATASLDDLQSAEYRQILDMVDRLRTCGLGSMLPLPQLVVCGNQSAGKSSVLEAITEVPFPRKENLCTRFATEIILRRDPTESIHTKIIPDSSRPESEKAKLSAFKECISDFSELPDLIEKATELMGLNDTSEFSSTRAFSRDILSLEIAGPNRPQLTLVDLPGLILSANKSQTEDDIKLIHSLVGDYIAEKRTIMLAVISAKDDYANQGILTKCKEVDKDGQRTLGIITKPDYLREGSKNQETWINLAQNNDIYFELGWHMLKNRPEEMMDDSFESRNTSERAFFASGKYRDLSDQDKGITHLRTKLSKLLFKHLKKELPNLQAELNAKHAQTMASLEQLGDKRSTSSEQKRFLMNVAMSYQVIVSNAVDGHYEDAFFGPIDTTKHFEAPSNMRRLRAVVQHLNLQFASQMRQYGHTYRIWATESTSGTNSKKDLPEPDLVDDYADAQTLQTVLSRDDAVEWAKSILIRTRGRELPGNFNPLLASQLFWEQSMNWEQLAREHIDLVGELCSNFVLVAIEGVVTSDVATRLYNARLNAALKARLANSREELRKLIVDQQRAPSTCDPSYTATVQEGRSQKTTAKIQALMNSATVPYEPAATFGRTNEPMQLVNAQLLSNQLKELVEPDMDKTSAEDALDGQLAYYKDQVKYFITAVTNQAIERHLLADLAQDTLSPVIIHEMSDGEIAYVAAEAEEVTHKRAYLEGHKAILESGQDAFREALGAYK